MDSIQLVSRVPLEQVRTVAVTPESATSAVLTRILLPDAEQLPLEAEADAKLLIGDAALALGVRRSDAAPRPRPAVARADGAADGVRGLGGSRARGRRRPKELEEALVESVRQARAEPEALAREAAERYGYPPGFLARYFEKLRYRFGPRERAGLYTFLELAHGAGELDGGARASLRARGGARMSRDRGTISVSVPDVLQKALAGERISDDDALVLLESRDLVAVGPSRRRACAPARSIRHA